MARYAMDDGTVVDTKNATARRRALSPRAWS